MVENKFDEIDKVLSSIALTTYYEPNNNMVKWSFENFNVTCFCKIEYIICYNGIVSCRFPVVENDVLDKIYNMIFHEYTNAKKAMISSEKQMNTFNKMVKI